MSDPKETNARIQNIRIKNLEQQIQIIHGEVRRLRDGVLQTNEMKKLENLMEKLKGMTVILVELKNYYNSMQQTLLRKNSNINTKQNSHYGVGYGKDIKNQYHLQEYDKRDESSNIMHAKKHNERENAGLDQKASASEFHRKSDLLKSTTETGNGEIKNLDPFKTCKQLMEQIKPPGSILGNYHMRLQDFRADPKLRYQRWEKKMQEKLHKQQLQRSIKLPSEDKATITEEIVNRSSIEVKNSEPLTSLTPDTTLDKSFSDRNLNNSADAQHLETNSDLSYKIPIIRKNLQQAIEKIINDTDKSAYVLTIVLENDLYNIILSQISDGQQLASFQATDEAIQDAKLHDLFQDFLTFFVVNAENSKSQRDRIIGHLFEFIRMDSP